MLGWLVSYPKSGNTWLRMLLSSLAAGGRSLDINERHDCGGPTTYAELDDLLGIESCELTPMELASACAAYHGALGALAGGATMLRKVHDRFWRVPTGEAVFPAAVSRSAIYLVRDPRDVAVSYAHHRGRDVDWAIAFMADETTTLAAAGGLMRVQLPQPLGSWSSHAASWQEQDEIPVMPVRYEDLLSDPVHHLIAAATWLGLPSDPGAAALAVAATRFEILRAQEDISGFVERRSGSTAPFFREGRAGGWRTHLTAAQADGIVGRHRDVMTRFGYV